MDETLIEAARNNDTTDLEANLVNLSRDVLDQLQELALEHNSRDFAQLVIRANEILASTENQVQEPGFADYDHTDPIDATENQVQEVGLADDDHTDPIDANDNTDHMIRMPLDNTRNGTETTDQTRMMRRDIEIALENGDVDLELVEQLILLDRNLCLTKDWFGEMPLHIAAKNGKVDVINLILKYCPESVKEVTATTMETCFDLAIRHNKIEVVVHLLNWIIWERPDFPYLLNYRDNEGDRALQFYFSSKLLKSIGVVHSGKLSVANALNSGGSMALDNSYYLPHSEKVDIVTDKILHKPRDTGLSNNSAALRGDVYSHKGFPSVHHI